MENQRHSVIRNILLVLMVSIIIFTFSACEDAENVSTQPDTPKTLVEFKNLEQYPATIYSDVERLNVITRVGKLGTVTVPAVPAQFGTAFYPTFHFDLFDMPGIIVSYNAPHIVTLIEDKKTTKVPIPKLESIEINSAYIKITNNSDFSLTLRQGNTEILTLIEKKVIVITGQKAVYEVTPGPVSSYTFMRNTTIPVEFPATVSEFKSGIIYSFTYTNAGLALTTQASVLQIIPPAVPENVQAEVISTNSARITWNEVSGALSYGVYRATSAEGTYSSVGTSASYTNTSLSAGQAYYYKITALSGEKGESAKSTAAIAIMSPANVRVTATSANSISLAWNAFSGASGYNIYRSGSEDGIYSKVNTAAVTGAVFTDTGLSQDAAYWYKVSAIIDGAEGLLSTQIPASTSSAPGNVRVTAGTVNSVSLAWNVVSEASGYNVYRSDSENGIYSQINTDALTGTEFTDTDLSQDVIYWYKVSAIINGIEGIQSSPVAGNVVIVPGSGLAEKLSWLQTNALSNVDYTIEVTAAESIGPTTLSYSNKTNIGITLKGTGAVRTVSLSSNGAMFTVASGVTLVLDNNITLQGRSDNNASLVRVNEGGTLVMNTGSRITSNKSSASIGGGVNVNGTFIMNGGAISGNTSYAGGGVYVGSNGTFTMSGGTISGNTVSGYSSGSTTYTSYGGGVAVWSGTFTMSGGTISSNTASSGSGGGVGVYYGTFSKTGGTIYGYSASDTSNSNVAKNSSGAVVNDRGHAVYAYYSSSVIKRRETTAGTSVNMSFNGSNGTFSGEWDN